MVTLTLVSDDHDENGDDIDELLRLAELLKEQFPNSTRTVEILIENYTECLSSLLDDYRGLGDAS